MDSTSDEQTELLRNIWNQIKQLDLNLGRRIDRTSTEVAGVKQEVTALRGDVDALKVEVGGVKQEVTALRGDVDGLKVEVGGVKQEITVLRGDVVGLKQEVIELRHNMVVETKALRVAAQGGFELLARGQVGGDREVDELRTRIELVEAHVGLRRPG